MVLGLELEQQVLGGALLKREKYPLRPGGVQYLYTKV